MKCLHLKVSQFTLGIVVGVASVLLTRVWSTFHPYHSETDKDIDWPDPPADPTIRRVYEILQQFALGDQVDFVFPDTFSGHDRRQVHQLVRSFGFHSSSELRDRAKHIKVSKSSANVPSSDPLRLLVTNFVESSDTELVLDHQSRSDRGKVHWIAEELGLFHESIGCKSGRCVRLRKKDKLKVQQQQFQMDKLKQSLALFKQKHKSHYDTFPQLLEEIKDLSHIKFFRYVDWNIQWMDHFFTDSGTFHSSTGSIKDVHALCLSIAGLLSELNADVVAVQEGPRSIDRMQLFVQKYLADEFAVIGGVEEGKSVSQQLYFLVRKNGQLKNAKIHHEIDRFLKQQWIFDVNGDFNLQSYAFTRRPLVIQGNVELNGKTETLILCTVHSKSKSINAGKRLWESKDPTQVQEFIQKAVRNRRRIAGESLRLRKALDELFHSDAAPLLIVSGDFNDGPGMDFFEENYLLSDCIEILLGSPFYAKKVLHSLLQKNKFVHESEQWSVEFDDYVDGVRSKRVLIDHIFVSEECYKKVLRAGIAHSEYNRYVTVKGAYSRDNSPSDHRPVFVDIVL